jgi:hypothetical protein
MADHESKIAYFRMELSKAPKVTFELIRQVVTCGTFPLSEEDSEQIIRHLEHNFNIDQNVGSRLVSVDYKPWLSELKNRNEIDFFYWNRLKKFYLERGVLPPKVVSILDDDTNDILDYSGNPELEGTWKRRGMVMGHVQSGKTTNYSALICKAADAGYRIIILLAGITNSLRQQTQERLDEAFIGKKSVFQAAAQQQLPIINFAAQRRFPVYGTSRDRDFSKQAAMTYGISLAALNEPIIFVTKKNKTTLERLRDWLKDQNLAEKIGEPLLMIDDEADNASINTADSPNQVTAINKAIREILAMFSRSTYIGYTATPFANIFIDPESETEMLEDDLFPRDFIKALDPPTNYVGASRIFAEDGDLGETMIVSLDPEKDDFETILPLKHKRDWVLTELPDSLKDAVRAFIITRAVRVLRGQGEQHCSMMINVSRFNDIQQTVHGLVYSYLERLRNSITINSGLGATALKDEEIYRISDTYSNRFLGIEYNFLDILPALATGVNSISVRTINMRGGVLDYSKHKVSGLHVIAIGGLALSRGLTLEGLTVSYILRNASASDTLMQMARWFGYRPDYEDICRLYLPEQSADHYEFITGSIEELRSEIKRMESIQMTPKDFGLRVRHNPAAIRITAANKMRTATAMRIAQDFSGRHIEGHVLYNDDKINKEHIALIRNLLKSCGAPTIRNDRFLYWKKINVSKVFPFIRQFRFPEAHEFLGPISDRSLLVDYISDRVEADLNEWDIAVPISTKNVHFTDLILEGETISIRERFAGETRDGNKYYRVTGSKSKAANPGDETIGLDDDQKIAAKAVNDAGSIRRGCCSFSHQRKRPLMLVHVFSPKLKSDKAGQELKISIPGVTLSFCLPVTAVPAQERLYQVNKVYRDQILQSSIEPDDDDKMTSEADDV